MFKSLENKFKAANGVATLPVIILIGGVLIEIGIAGAFMAYFLSQSGFGIKLSEEALAVARAGIQDAEMKIVRDKNFVLCPSSDPCILNVGNNSTQIIVCKDTCAGTGKFEITSLGSAFTKRRQIRAILSVSSTTGEVELESEKEISL